jgi:hypothetical protein
MSRSTRPISVSVSLSALAIVVAFSAGVPCACAQAAQLPGLNQFETQNVQLVIRNLDALVKVFETAGQNAGQGNNPDVKIVVPGKETAGSTRTLTLSGYFNVEVAQYRAVLTNLQGKFQGNHIHSIPGLNKAPGKYIVGDPTKQDDVNKALHPNAAFCVPNTFIKIGTDWVPCPEGDIVIDSSHTDPGSGTAIDESIAPPQLKQGQKPPPGQHGWAEKWQLLHILVHEKWHERMIAEEVKLTNEKIETAKGKTGQGPGISDTTAETMRNAARANGADGEHHKQVYMAQKAVLYLEYKSLQQDLAAKNNDLKTLQKHPTDNAAAMTTTKAEITVINQKMTWLLAEIDRVEDAMKHATDKEFEYANCGGAGDLHDGTIAMYATDETEYFRVDVDLAGGKPTDSRLTEVFVAGEVHPEDEEPNTPALYVAMPEDVFTGLEVQPDTCPFLSWATANGWVHTGPSFTSIADFVPHPLTESNAAGAESHEPASANPPAAAAPPERTAQQPNSDYGSGGHAVVQNDTAGAELKGAVYDPSGTLRHEETNTYTTTGGVEHKIEQHAYDFDFKGHLQLGLDYKYDLRGGLNYTDITHYGLHGERVAEEVTNYRTDSYEIKDWSLGTHQWYTNTVPYKTPLPAGTPTQAPLTPTSTDIGVIIPRSYLPGETITGSLWPSKYAENFKSVPGLSEYSFPIELYHLPDGSPEWSSLRIGVKGDGYVPVNPNGTFSLHIPLNWKGSLELQARQPDPVAGIGPTDAQLNFDPPVAAPTVSNDQFSSSAQERFSFYSKDHLIELWQDACDDEELLNELYDAEHPDWDRIYAIEDRLDDTYDDIDEIEDDMPTSEVISLAQSMYREAINFQTWLGGQPTLSADDKDDIEDSKSWSDFLKDEIDYNKSLAFWGPTEHLIQPFSTNPVLMQGKLGVIRGSYPIDPYDTYIHIDKFPITPLAATRYNWYFMPPAGLTAGQHDYIIDSPLYSETIFPVFLMTLYMSADNLNLLKGQSTMYHVVLSGLNGLPGGAWSGSSDPTDLVPSSQLSAAQKAVGTSRTGYISLSITNGSPGVIAMQNQFLTYDAASFVPNGSHQTDGEVTALVRGNFIINGEAIAHLDPEIGVGIPPGTALPTGLTIPPAGSPSGNWLPSFSLNYDPAAFSNSSFMTNSCPGSSATPSTTTPNPAGGTPAATPCVESVVKDLMPLKSTTQNNNLKGNTPDQDEAHKHLEELKEKEKATLQARLGSESQVDQLFTTGLSNAPAALRINLKDAEEKLKNATTEREKASAAELENSTEETQNKFTDAMNNESMAQADYDSAKQKVIDSFDEDARKEYDAALKVFNEAYEDWRNAFNEMREAEEDLQKQQQKPVDEVM